MRLLLVVSTTLAEASNEIDVSESVQKLEISSSLMLLVKKSGEYEEGFKWRIDSSLLIKESMLARNIRGLRPKSQANYNQAACTGMELAERWTSFFSLK